MMSKRVLVTVSCLFALSCICSPGAMGQMAGTGSVAGTVTDPWGAVVVGAQVPLTDASTNAQRTATSNEAGRYLFPNLPPVTYSMTTPKVAFPVAQVSSLPVNPRHTLNVP